MPANYAIYKALFEVSQQKSMFVKETGQSAFDEAQRLFAEVITEPVMLPGEDIGGKAGTTLYIDPYCQREDIYVLVVCNEKSHHYLDRLDEKELISHPGCFVVVDNRPGYGQIAIQRSSSFYYSVEKIRKLLLVAWGRKMSHYYGLTLKIPPCIRPGKFWEVIGEHTRQRHRVKKVTFNFPNPQLAGPINATDEVKKKMEDYTAIVGAMNAAKASLTVFSDKKNQIRLEKTVSDVAEVVSLCEANGGIYSIAVHFHNGIVYRFGQATQFFMDMEDGVIDGFKSGLTQLGFPDHDERTLKGWLDTIWNLPKTIGNDIPAPKRRKAPGSLTVRG